ncbi:MAG: DUF5060 domain-containing protein [Phycisphaerae bacterium]
MTSCAGLLAMAMAMAATMPADGKEVPKYGLFELTFSSKEKFHNPFWDAQVSAVFTSPTGKKIAVDGFYFGGDQWRIRFVPREEGRWTYTAVMKGGAAPVERAGAFTCKGSAGDGFLKLSKKNPYRMEYDSGRPFYSIGIQTCGVIRQVDFDGPADDGGWRAVPVAQWCDAFKGAVNLVRIQLGAGTTAGLAVPLIPVDADKDGRGRPTTNRAKEILIDGKPDRYDLEICALLDEAYKLHRKAGFSEICILFQDMSPFSNKSRSAFGDVRDTTNYKNLKAENLPLQEKYIRYVIARYGAFVDIWEIFNEDTYAPDDYLAHLARVIRDADPYQHIITTNFARPEKEWCEIVTPHEYVSIPANDVDARLASQIGVLKSYGKPVQYTEFGNKNNFSNDDPIKWRVAAWTAFMNESGMLFWSMSGTKTTSKPAVTGNANTYIGAESRGHFRVFMDFVRDLPIDMRPRTVYPYRKDLRCYALSNGAVTVVYVHHYADYDKPYKTLDPVEIETGPGRYRITWIDPADGKPLKDEARTTTRHRWLSLRVPEMKVDAACRIEKIEDAE